MSTEETPAKTAWAPERRPWGFGDLLAVVAWTAALAYFFRDALFLGKSLFYFDITEINYPYRDFLANELRAGRFSRWHPGINNGLPLFAESQAGYLHPLKYLLYPWMETWRALNLDTILSIWLTGLATYGWLRRHVGASGALTGAALFGLSGFVWAHLIHTSMTNALISVPIAFWGLEVAWDGGRLRGLAMGALALACQVFAGHLQDTILTGGALGVYALCRASTAGSRRGRIKALGFVSLLGALGVAVSAVQWVPSKDLLDRSPRVGGLSWEQITYGSWSPELLPTLAVREAYGTLARDTDWPDGYYPYHEMNTYLGLIGLALGVVGAGASRDRWVASWIVLAGLGSVFMLGRYTALFDSMNLVPVVGSSRIPVRYHLWVSLAVAALAGVGVDRLSRPGRVRLGWAACFGLAILSGSITIGLYVYRVPFWTHISLPLDVAALIGIVLIGVMELSRVRIGRVEVLAVAGAMAATAVVSLLGLLFILPLPSSHSDPLDSRRWNTPEHREHFQWLGREFAIGVGRSSVLGIAAWALILRASKEPEAGRRRRLMAPLPLLVIADLLGSHSADVPTIDPSYWSVPPESASLIKADPSAIRVFGTAEKSSAEPGFASRPVDFFEIRDTLAWSLPPVWGLSSAIGHTPIYPRRMLTFHEHASPIRTRFEAEGVSHLVSGRAIAGFPGTPVRAGSAWIYKLDGVQPRARLMGRPAYVDDEAAAAKALDELGPEIRDRLIVEDPDRPLPADAVAEGSARIAVDLPERVEIEVDARTPSYLVLADTFDTGWSATVDDRPAPIRPAFAGFRAVFVKPGAHRVDFTYEPAGFRKGLILSILGLIGVLACLVWPRAVAEPDPAHAPVPWPRLWPLGFSVILLLFVLGSAVKVGPDGVRLHSRWDGAFHRFTWAADIDAIRPMSKMLGR